MAGNEGSHTLAESRRLSIAFLEHRLKRVKVRGRHTHRVEVLPPAPPEGEVQTRFAAITA